MSKFNGIINTIKRDIQFEGFLKNILYNIKAIREYAIEEDQLNEQWFIDFLDDLNALSIDPDENEINEIKNRKYEV